LTTGWAVIVAAVTVQASYLFSPDLSLYFKSMRVVGANIIPDYPYYVQGRFIPGGIWWYLLYAFLLKTPLPTLIAVAVAGTACVLDRDRSGKALIFLLLPAVIYTIAMCAYADNLGVRYMVPVTAFLLVLSGRSYFVFTASRRRKILAGALAAWLLVSVLRVSPHYISYFNELAGGPENGPYFLDDSNIDWGQDLKRLMRYLNENGIKEAVISYWGPTPPEYYADRYGLRLIPWTFSMASSPNPPPEIYALSVNRLVEVNRTSFGLTYGTDQSANWLKRFKPSALIGYSIYIYKFPGEGKNPDSLTHGRQG